MKWTCMALVLLCGCRMGGRGGSALALVEPEEDAGIEAAMEAGAGASGGGGQGTTGGTTGNAATTGPSTGDPMMNDDDGGSVPVVDAGTTVDAGPSTPSACAPTVEGCDPIQNTGCVPLTQCAVDPAGNGTAGACIFSNAQVPPGTNGCVQDAFTTSCPPHHGCIEGECLRYCACDADCAVGSTCSVQVSTSGAAVYRACTP